MRMTVNLKDVIAGSVCVVAGLAFAIAALRTLSIGGAARMGPGYFPLLLGGLLCVLGLAIILRGLRSVPAPLEGVTWRGMLLIGGAPLVFAATVVPLGLVPSLFLATLLAAISSRDASFLRILVITVGIVVFCITVFSYGLGLPVPLFGPVLWGRA